MLGWVEEGTAPTAENFDNILFREDGTILIRFDKYQVAAGVEGVVEISLAVDAIADLLKPEIRELLGVEADEGRKAAESAMLAVRIAGPNGLSAAPSVSAAGLQLASAAARKADLASIYEADATEADEINCYEVPCVALTFDDGPSVYTEGLLDILKEREVRATFFILGKSARVQSETVSRMSAEGHQIGNHTWDHPNLTQLSDELIQQQIGQTDDIVTQITGRPTQHLRPPYGAYNDRVLAVSGLPIIFWSVDPLDWKDRDAGRCGS